MLMNILPIKALEKTLNGYLSLDKESAQLLLPLKGKVLALHIKRPHLSLYFSFEQESLSLSSERPEQVNTEIYASLFQLMRLKFRKEKSLVNTELYIKGDVDTAQAFNQVLEKHHIDWEEYLSKIIGDVASHKMMQLIKKPADFFKRNKEKLRQDIRDYCQEESDLLPSPNEVAYFRQEVDELRLKLDRLEANIHLLKKKND